MAVVQSRSFAEAAIALHLSQPALSSAIQVLEAMVGGQLLVRTTRTFALTPEGEGFYPVALRLLADWDGAFNDLHKRFALREGKISIAAMPSFASNQLPIAMRNFKNNYPEVQITLNDVIAEEVVAMVRSGRVELGISFEPGDGKRQGNDALIFTPLFDDCFVAVLPPEHALLKQTQLSAKELLEFDFISLQAPSVVRKVIFREFASHGLSIVAAYEAHQLATIGRMVANGLGVSVVPSLCQKQMYELGAHCRPLLKPMIRQQVGLITHRHYPLSVACHAMANILQENFANGVASVC